MANESKLIPLSSKSIYNVNFDKNNCELNGSGKTQKGVTENPPFTNTTHRYFRDKQIIAEYWLDTFCRRNFCSLC